MRGASLAWYRLRWPREVMPEQLTLACRLLASVAGTPVVLEASGFQGRVEHYLALPAGDAGTVEQIRVAIPGLAVEKCAARPAVTAARAAEIRLSTRQRPLHTSDLSGVSRALLAALADVGRDERLGIQWVLARPLAATAVSSRAEVVGRESWLGALLLAPFGPPRPADQELRSAIRTKQSQPGWRAVGRLSVQATTGDRQRQLLRQLMGALRSAEAPGVSFRFYPTRASSFRTARVGWRWPLRLNSDELAAISALPAGSTRELPVDRTGSRLLAPPRALPRSGRVVACASYPGDERPVALTVKDSLRHLHVLGPSGVGKSTLLASLIAQDMQAGRAVVVIEPKSDLIADVLARVPSERVGDVVLLDPADHERPVAINPLAAHGRSPELVADQLLGMFHSLYAAHWGPRTHDIFAASLLTLTRQPGMTIPALPLLLTDAGFRRRVLSQVNDPLGLAPFWSAYEGWSEAERLAAISPVMNKLRPLLLRPEMRAMLGQRQGFDLRRIFTERKIVLVNLSKGLLGPETSALLGSLIVSQLWQVILGRSAIAPEKRHPVFVYVDEFQDYMHLPLDFADALAQARGLGVGFALAHQYLHQLDPALRSAVLANVQSRIAFRLPSEDARTLAADGLLSPEDFQSLGAFECYLQAVAGGAVQPWCSARTLPPSEPVSDPARVREASRIKYGADRKQVEAELRELFSAARDTDDDDLTPRRRPRGGRS